MIEEQYAIGQRHGLQAPASKPGVLVDCQQDSTKACQAHFEPDKRHNTLVEGERHHRICFTPALLNMQLGE